MNIINDKTEQDSKKKKKKKTNCRNGKSDNSVPLQMCQLWNIAVLCGEDDDAVCKRGLDWIISSPSLASGMSPSLSLVNSKGAGCITEKKKKKSI